LGKILADEAGGVTADGAVGGLVGGKEETDWACAAAAAGVNNPKPSTVDLNTLDIPDTPVVE